MTIMLIRTYGTVAVESDPARLFVAAGSDGSGSSHLVLGHVLNSPRIQRIQRAGPGEGQVFGSIIRIIICIIHTYDMNVIAAEQRLAPQLYLYLVMLCR